MMRELKSNENDITAVLENLEKEQKARKVRDSPSVLWCFLPPPSKLAQERHSSVKGKHTHKGELSDILLHQLRIAKPNNISTLKLISLCGKTKKDVNSALYALQAKGLVKKVVNSPPRWIATDFNVVTTATDMNCESLQEQMQAVAINQHSHVTSAGAEKNKMQIKTEEVNHNSGHFNHQVQVKMEAEEIESKCADSPNLTNGERSNTGLSLSHNFSLKRSTRKNLVGSEPPPLIPVDLHASLKASQNTSNVPSFPHEILSKRQTEFHCHGQQTAMDTSQPVNFTHANTGYDSNQAFSMNQQQRFQQPLFTTNFSEHGPNRHLPQFLPLQSSNDRFRPPIGPRQLLNTRQQMSKQPASCFPSQRFLTEAFSSHSNQGFSHSSQNMPNQNFVAQRQAPRSNMTAFFNGIRNAAPNHVVKTPAHSRNISPYQPQLNPNPISALVHYATLHRKKLIYEELGHEGPDHSARFISRCKLGTQKFPSVLAVNKKEGKTKAHKLALDIIHEHVSDRAAQMQFDKELQELNSLCGSSVEGGSQKVLSKNPISLLMELCQAKNMPAPTLDAVRDNTKKQYHCTCVIGEMRFPSVTARSKQEGKTNAYRIALEKLQHNGEQITQSMFTSQTPASDKEDAVSELTKMATQRGVIAKLEILRQYGPPHDPRFECCCYFGEQKFPTVVACSKKEGKKKAFEIALRHLNGKNGEDNSNVTLPAGAKISQEKRTVDSSSEITISSVDQELAMSEINSAINNLRSFSQFSASTGQQEQLIPSQDALKTLHKQPISAFMEFGQSRGLQPTIVLLNQTGASHCPKFEVRCCFKDRLFPSVFCGSMKEARTQAAEVALKCLMAEGSFSVVKPNSQGSHSSTTSLAMEQQTNIPTEKAKAIASLVVQKFNELQSHLMQYSMGKVVLAGLVLEQADGQLHLISLGTGNRCITGEKLSLDGSTVNDCHAEIITRRGFIRFLCVEVGKHLQDTEKSIFYVTENGMLAVKPTIKFHLYISTAPCGDGALFTPNDNGISVSDEIMGGKHRPLFTSNVHGLLRTKIETGEGTIPIPDNIGEQTFDGLIRGDHRLRTMSCSDKMCRWNVLGLQGGLLSNLLYPIYLESLTLGQLFNAGHLSRALCCRVDELSSDLPENFRVNHVDLGCTGEDVPRGTAKTKHISINWTYHDGDSVEVLDGTQGKLMNGQTSSRLSKKKLFENFKALCEMLGQSHLVQENYLKSKHGCANYVEAKEMFYKLFLTKKRGTWVQKPREEQMFG